MRGIGEYLLSVISAAVICAIAKHLIEGKGTGSKILHVITGLFLLVTLISPIKEIHIASIEDIFSDFQFDAESYAASGAEMATEDLKDIIKQQTEAYILDETARFGTQLNVEVKLSDSYPHEPYQVVIKGSVSPYQKQYISRYISQNLGISQEHQIWN